MPDLSEFNDYTLSKTTQYSGESVVDGADTMRYRHVLLLRGMLYEMEPDGAVVSHVSFRDPSCTTIVEREFGFVGSKREIAQQFFNTLVEKKVMIKKIADSAKE